MKNLFITVVLLVFSFHNALANENSKEKSKSYKLNFEFSNFEQIMFFAKYTCTVSYTDEYGNNHQSTGTSDTSARDACNKALRHTQTNDALPIDDD